MVIGVQSSSVGRQRGAVQRLLRRHAPPATPPHPEPEVDRLALVNLAARVGSRALVSGASAAEATQMMVRLGLSYGVRIQADVTYTSLTVSSAEVATDLPVTVVRTVPLLDRDYGQLAELERLVGEVSSHRLTVAEAMTQLQAPRVQRLDYRPWVLRTGAFLQGASICLLLGGGLVEVAIAGLATFLTEMVLGRLSRRMTSYFFAQVIAGAIPMMIAVALMVARSHGVSELWLVSPSLVVAAGMVTMLAGMGVVGAAQDALDGYYITAWARIGDLLMRTGGLLAGVVGVLWLSVHLGLPAYLTADVLLPPGSAVQVGAVGVFSLVFAVSVRLGPRGALVGAAFGAFGWTIYLTLMRLLSDEHALAAGGTAVAVAFVAQVLSRRLVIPAIALVTVGIAPLMPGLILYRGLYRLVVGVPAVDPRDAVGQLFLLAALTGVALALGSSVGLTLGRHFTVSARGDQQSSSR